MIDQLSKPTRQKIVTVCIAIGMFLVYRQLDLRIAVPLGILMVLAGVFRAPRLALILIVLLCMAGFSAGLMSQNIWLMLGGPALALTSMVAWRGYWKKGLPAATPLS